VTGSVLRGLKIRPRVVDGSFFRDTLRQANHEGGSIRAIVVDGLLGGQGLQLSAAT
jgi:hypothetical protein